MFIEQFGKYTKLSLFGFWAMGLEDHGVDGGRAIGLQDRMLGEITGLQWDRVGCSVFGRERSSEGAE